MKNVNIYTSIILFTVSCSTNLPLVDEQIESSSQDVSKAEKKNIDSFSSDSGVQSFMDGMLFLEQGDYARAILEFQESIEKGSQSAEVYFSMSEAYWMIQKYEKSILFSKKAISIDNNAVDYKISLGKKYIALNRYNESMIVFESIIDNDPNNADVLFIIGDLKAKLNDIDGALIYYDEAYNKDNSLILALQVAAQLAYDNNHRDTSKLFKKLLLAEPSNSEYLRGYIETIQGPDILDELKELIQNEKIKANPFYNNLYNQMALEFIKNRQFSDAESFLRKALDEKEDDRFSLYYLSLVYREIGRNDLSLDISRKHSKYFPNDKEGYINSAISLIQMQRYDEAIDELNIALTLYPEDFEINYFLGLTNYSLNDYLNAEKYYNISLKLDDQSIATMHGLAMTYDNLQKWDMSDDLYIQLIALNQNDAQAYNNYAYSLVERNEEIDYALTLAEKAIEISPNTSAYLDTIGWIHYKLGNYTIAKDFIAKAILIDESSAVILEHYGDVLIKLEDFNEALIFYNKALLIEPNNTTLLSKIEEYEKQ
tara:strand:+ start:510 stop:2132 length:1623 start_codon:yes stop_codon:yes gene_type:complete